jgi:hypothetical protein
MTDRAADPQPTVIEEDKMTIDLRPAPTPRVSTGSAFSFASAAARAAPIEPARLDYAYVELPQAEASDFDLQTIAIVGGIVIFKLSMLGLLLMSL